MKFVLNPKFIPAVQTRSQKALMKAGLYVETMLKKAVPKDTGELQKSIFHDLIKSNTVRVGSLSWSAYVAEKGRKPWKMPPLDALVGRIIRKKGLPGMVTRPWAEQPKETQSAVFGLARKLATKKLEAKHIFSKTWETNKDKATQIYFETLKR